MKLGSGVGKRCAEIGKASGELVVELSAGSQSKDRRQLIHKIEGEHIGEVEKDDPLYIKLLSHSSTPRSFVLTLTFSLCCALACSRLRESFCLREGLSFCLTVLAENSLKA